MQDALAVGGELRFLYDLEQSLQEKIEAVAHNVYGAGRVVYQRRAELTLRRMKRMQMEDLPVCIAKTQYSLSTNPGLRGRPSQFDVPARDVKVSAGAGFVVFFTGDIMTMPGLPRRPAAETIDFDDDRHTVGLF